MAADGEAWPEIGLTGARFVGGGRRRQKLVAAPRPYVFTGGRTRTHVQLELETLVSTGPQLPTEHHAVVELCRRPISVAEVAARMEVPIGVAKVVIGDLATSGALLVHATGFQDVPDVAFLERVLTGLRRL